MTSYHLKRTQVLPISLQRAWEFFSDPANLGKITPPAMGFVIVSGADEPMYEGQLIKYIVKPIWGIPVEWVSRITNIVPGKRFIDEQVKGPYKLWRHRHSFETVPGGVEIKDDVEYALPYGVLGTIAHALVIKRQLDAIFDYRQKVLEELFPVPTQVMK